MNSSPFSNTVAFHLGPVAISEVVVVTWLTMLIMISVCALLTRKLELQPNKKQAALELFVTALDTQIYEIIQAKPDTYRGLVGSLFLFILIANWTSLVPGLEPPTATLETDAALALIVFCATIIFGIKAQGWRGYLKTFTQPSWIMIPVNVFQQITRTFSMIIRLFGNVMSGMFIVGIVLSLTGLLVPIPLMALDLLTGAVQAYIFAILSLVFIGAAIGKVDQKQTRGNHHEPDRSR